MAKRTPEAPTGNEITIPAELVLSRETVDRIAGSVEGDDLPSNKVIRVALGLLGSIAAGGVLMPELQVRRVVEAAGREIDAADIADLAEQGAGRKNGKLAVTLEIDPTYEPMLQQVAQFQGVTVQEALQRATDAAWDNGWFYADLITQPDRVLMSTKEKAGLEKLLGKPFNTGTELCTLLREVLGVSLFDDVEVEKAEISTVEAPTVRSMLPGEWEALSDDEKKVRLKAGKEQETALIKRQEEQARLDKVAADAERAKRRDKYVNQGLELAGV